MLKIENIKAGYGQLEVLHGVDMEVNAGEIVAIIGPNGSGKSTILKSIFNLCNIYSGKIIWKDRDITKQKTYQKILEDISYVPQGRQVFRDLTVLENLEMGAFVFNNKEVMKKNIEEVYREFPFLKDKENKNADTLSGGQQQMLAIGRALIQNPQLLLMDEPSLGLSPKASQDIFNKVKEINKKGISVIIVEQNARQAVEIADKTYVLDNGKVVLTGGRDILNNPKIKNIYFGDS
ncbi:MAG: ABC transporter ATP-binding protein [Bacilli bacterium]|jgi:branched-chain amino acid transport system ATP-binding protein